MNRVLRAAIACLLLIAVPLQGYAAGTMLFCGGAASSATPAAADHHADDRAQQAPSMHAPAAAVSAEDGDGGLHDLLHGTCSVCASCCSGVALSPPPMAVRSAAPQAAPVADHEHANPLLGTARIERPPRLALA